MHRNGFTIKITDSELQIRVLYLRFMYYNCIFRRKARRAMEKDGTRGTAKAQPDGEQRNRTDAGRPGQSGAEGQEGKDSMGAGQDVRSGQASQNDKTQKEKQKEYEQYVKKVTPTHNLWLQMLKAFVTGGIICCLGQFILNYAAGMGLDKQTAGSWCSLTLVLLSVVLTGFNIYPKIVKWGGAGALVPITGFANSVAAPAIEYKTEGQVFGIGCKIFTIAGPVILYGIFASWVLGVVYWIGKMAGVI